MAKVKYTEKGGSGVSVMRWRVLPNGKILDPRGNVRAQLPDDVAYSRAAKRLADRGALSIEGYTPAKKTSPVPAPKKDPTNKQVGPEPESPEKKDKKKSGK
jgi:hypothetical protein